jgi:surface antigen
MYIPIDMDELLKTQLLQVCNGQAVLDLARTREGMITEYEAITESPIGELVTWKWNSTNPGWVKT